MMEAKCNNPNKFLLLCLLLILINYGNADPIIFNITDYGATPDEDITQALSKAWSEAISTTNWSIIVIPEGKWQLSQAILQGPNLGRLELQNLGTVEANVDYMSMGDVKSEWINIHYVNDFTLSGGGVFDGHGQEAWQSNNCKISLQNCTKLPHNFGLAYMTNSIIHDVTSRNSKYFHVNCVHSTNVTFTRFTVSAPANSPNTDGIHIARSTMVNVTDSGIGTGDDCISMGDHLRQVHIRNVTCGPGHDISIGSLGYHPDERNVSGIHVQSCSFTETTNGVRIKTWPSGPAELVVSDLLFEDLTMVNVANPVLIDQYYCPDNQCDPSNPSLVQIKNVEFNNVRGSTVTAEALQLLCSEAKPCLDVRIGDVDLAYAGSDEGLSITCANVNPTFYGIQNPPLMCLDS